MSDINSSLAWFRDRAGRVTYSMTYRNGPTSFDCSSSVYYALKQGGFFSASTYVGNTDSLFNDLEKNGWTKLPENAQGNFDTRVGDVFIWGVRGASGGAAGHTGMFSDADNIWNCNYGYNGITNNNYDWLHAVNGSPTQTFYRYTAGAAPVASNPVDQSLEVGSIVQFSKVYRADDVQEFEGIWQVRTTELCREGFTWEDNGIPAAPLVEVDVDGYATADQELATGSLYVVPGKYTVLDLGQSGSIWLAQFEAAGVKFWVDVETLTEIPDSDPGKGTPAARPTPVVQSPEPSQVPVPIIVTPPVTPPPAIKPVPAPDPVVSPSVDPQPEVVDTPPATPTAPTQSTTGLKALIIAFIAACSAIGAWVAGWLHH